jgi:hypothetical protein
MTQPYNLSNIPEIYRLLDPNVIHNSNILKLNKIESRTHNSIYKVIKYDKHMLSYDLVNSYGLCRSLITNNNGEVVCFAPPKSFSTDVFIKKYPLTDENKAIIQAQEFIEGTMINVFFDSSVGLTGTWEISTRNTVGATSTFYKLPNGPSKTFREMFMEACILIGLDINKLDKKFCYSFVLQHPLNRIVVPFSKPELYLVAVYKINNEPKNITIDFFDVYEFRLFFEEFNIKVKFPQKYDFNTYNELIDKFGSMNTSYDIVGVVLYNTLTGERSKIRNPVYEQVRLLRGNQPKLQYQYLCLRKEGKVREFLKYYPETKKDFSDFRDQVHLFTETLHSNYVSCYVKKQKPLLEYPEQFRTHMFKIHEIYMNELREKKLYVTNTIVQKYVNNLHSSLLMYSLNYPMRKRFIDNITYQPLNQVEC